MTAMAAPGADTVPFRHGGDLVARQIEAFGVGTLFTLTGGHISSVYDGARFTDLRIVDFRHEQAAVHAADASARLRRDVSVAALTAGPGVTGGVTGVANAFYAQSPVVTVGGRNPFLTDGAGNLQEAPHVDLMRPVTKAALAVHDAWRIGDVLYDAAATARAPRSGPTYVDLPMDVQLARFGPHEAPPTRALPQSAPARPDPDLVVRVARALGAARQPVILAGTGAYWAGAESALARVAELAGAPVYLNGMARGLLGRDHPAQVFGNRREALRAADLVLLVGADIDFRLGFGQPGIFGEDARLIQVAPDAERLGRNRDVDLAVVGDIRAFLEDLAARDGLFARTGPPGRWLAALRDKDRSRAEARARACEGDAGGPIAHERFVHEVAAALDPDATVIGDGGDIVSLFAGRHRPGGAGRWMDPGPFGCLGIGAPFAMASRLERPEAQIAVVFGDGAFGFNGFEYDSAVRQDLPFVGIIGNDGAWGEMRTFHEDVFGSADLTAQNLSQATRYETVVEGLGGHGERVERASEIGPAIRRALAAGVPALVNVLIDPAYRRANATISGREVARAYGGGDLDAFKR